MSRLPVPGQDTDIWGDILNDFLDVSHNADGTIKSSALPPPQIADGSITPSKLSQAYVPTANVGVPSGVAALDATGKVPSSQLPAAGSTPDATTTSKGVVQLAGDLGGTAAAPTVPGLAGKEPSITAGTTGQYFRGDKTWQTLDKTSVGLANVDNTSDINKPISTATQTALNAKADTSSLATVATTGSYNDLTNKPTIPTVSDATTTSKGVVQLAGDLGGTAAAPTVPGLAAKADTSSLATVATSGSYNDLTNKPTIPGQVNSDWNASSGVAQILNKPSLSTVATTGSYTDLTNQPTIPAAQVNADWNASSGVAQILNKPTFPSVSDATTTSKGIVQLAGDLGGTAAAPTVPGLANKVDTSSLGAASGVATLDGTSVLTSTQLPSRLSQSSLDASYAHYAHTTASYTTASLTGGAQETGTITMAATFLGLKVTLSGQGRVRLYMSTTQRDADLTRQPGTDPAVGTDHGVIMDVAMNAGGSLSLSPSVIGSAATSAIPITVSNLSASTQAVTATITYLRME